MKRSLFLLLVGISTLLFGASMIIAPSIAVEGNGFAPSVQLEYVFRLVAGSLIVIGILNLQVFNHDDSRTLKAILLFNVINHSVSTCIDIMTVANGIVAVNRMIFFFVVHFLIGGGSLFYLIRMNSRLRAGK